MACQAAQTDFMLMTKPDFDVIDTGGDDLGNYAWREVARLEFAAWR